MRYVCLVYFAEKRVGDQTLPSFVLDLAPSDLQAVAKDSNAYDEELKGRGHLIVAHALQPTDSAMTVRVRDGRMSATDGPFAETKEVLGGFLLIEARDLNEAIRIAADVPLAKLGSVEVRPVMGG
jgi:hypothetical protein